jgi:hypothetical protein
MSMVRTSILPSTPERPEDLTPADPEDLAAALAFALRFDVRRRNHDASEIMARIIARRLVEHLAQSGFVVMRKPTVLGAASIGRGHGE